MIKRNNEAIGRLWLLVKACAEEQIISKDSYKDNAVTLINLIKAQLSSNLLKKNNNNRIQRANLKAKNQNKLYN